MKSHHLSFSNFDTMIEEYYGISYKEPLPEFIKHDFKQEFFDLSKKEKHVLLTKRNRYSVKNWLVKHKLDNRVEKITNSKKLWNIYIKTVLRLKFNTIEDEEEFLNNPH